MISGSTRLAAVIGDPVRHSLSPAIHNAAFAACGLDWVYVALPVAKGHGAGAVDAMRTLGIEGMSVTMPHKVDVIDAVDELTGAAAALGVSNCLFWRDGKVVADSTDGDGFVTWFESDFRALAGTRVLVVGAGGAARSIVEAVGRAGPSDILVMNRSEPKAEEAALLAPQARAVAKGDSGSVGAVDVIVNATAVGMAGGPDPHGLPLPVDAIHGDQIVIDIVYQPRVTPLLLLAGQRGATIGGGVGMLVHQAALAFERWTGCDAPVDAMTGAATGTLPDRG